MNSNNPFMQSYEELPDTLGIFPLSNTVILPGCVLPLNIFEPRYLNMVRDALKSHQLIGMIQPRDETNNSELFDVGCAARITRYEETNDGRLQIYLTGLCRFDIKDELDTIRGYRLIVPNWDKFQSDFNVITESNHSDKVFLNALKHYFTKTEFNLDWKVIETLSPVDQFNALFGFIELSSTDKQMLLEIDTHHERVKALTALLNSNFDKNAGNDSQRH